MPKRAKWLLVPAVGAFAFFVTSTGRLPGRALADGGGTKVYSTDGADVKIFVDPVNGTLAASGAMGTTRSEPFPTATPVQKEIGCWVDAAVAGAMFTCQAIANGVTLRCSSVLAFPWSDLPEILQDSGFVQAIASISDDSFIQFTTDMAPGGTRGVGDCISITVDNNSKYYPRVP